ncbi:unnamed protein product [Paramecium octaurelia]|uniref:Uncharacterized protein n=1 Tax=Paramecium octaurelia TaxID=43137 RepID=A0A8S1U4Q3_PAROT|nr:unnamed protein product [Paramecium octaurelia]
MNKLYIESIKASAELIPIDIYFLLKIGEHCQFSNILSLQQQSQTCNMCIQYQAREKQPISIECWAYDQHLVPKAFFGKETLTNTTRKITLDGMEIQIRQSQQERSRTPEIAMKRDASPFGRRDLTPKREKK